MRRIDGYALARWHFEPSIRRPTAGKDKRVYAVALDDSEFKIAIKRRRRNLFPVLPVVHRFCSRGFFGFGLLRSLPDHAAIAWINLLSATPEVH